MNYIIEPVSPLSHLLKITLNTSCIAGSPMLFQLSIWRPGRYEAANYSKNIKAFKASDAKGEPIPYSKQDSSTWELLCDTPKMTIEYYYYAHALDAGNSWYDDNQVYINFINCLIYCPEKIMDECEVKLKLPKDYKIACGIEESEKHTLKAENYYHLVDSPLIASNSLAHITYDCSGIEFKVWFQGEHAMNLEKVKNDFSRFTAHQIKMMGEFPENDYHFLNEITSYKHYHGVEHGNSTVICIGPGEELNTHSLYSEFLGVSSHELFHAWNILKIRPFELMPYKFNQAPIFPTGYVAEGFTTYYGDLFLVQSGVFDFQWYFNELNKLFTRHFHNYGRLSNSVIDSSIDLWVDGYQISAPHKKSSIYVEGAVIALCLDLMIRKQHASTKSLDDVMRLLWNKFGKTGNGYRLEDIQQCCEDVYGESLNDFFKNHVYGTLDKRSLVTELLENAGCQLKFEENESLTEDKLGIKTQQTNEHWIITATEPTSVGEQYFSIKDKIISVNGEIISEDILTQVKSGDILDFRILRNGEMKSIDLKIGADNYYKLPVVTKQKNPSEAQKDFFEEWLKCQY